MSETCGHCRWWAGRISGRVQTPGICKRYPPGLMVHHKFMSADEWCGEFTPLPKAPDHE